MHGWKQFWAGFGSLFNMFPTRTSYVRTETCATEIELSKEELEELQKEFDTAFRDLDRVNDSMHRAIQRAKERKLNGDKDNMSKAA